MKEATPIGPQGVTPEVLVQHIAKDIDKIEEIYCVAYAKDGQTFQYVAGTIKGMAFASIVLQDHALRASLSVARGVS